MDETLFIIKPDNHQNNKMKRWWISSFLNKWDKIIWSWNILLINKNEIRLLRLRSWDNNIFSLINSNLVSALPNSVNSYSFLDKETIGKLWSLYLWTRRRLVFCNFLISGQGEQEEGLNFFHRHGDLYPHSLTAWLVIISSSFIIDLSWEPGIDTEKNDQSWDYEGHDTDRVPVIKCW